MRAYSLDLRVRVLTAFDAGLNYADVARRYTVSAEWVRILVRRRTLTGEVAARKPVSGRVPFHQRHAAELRAAIAEKPDLTLHQLRDRLQLDVSIGTLWNALQALKTTSWSTFTDGTPGVCTTALAGLASKVTSTCARFDLPTIQLGAGDADHYTEFHPVLYSQF